MQFSDSIITEAKKIALEMISSGADQIKELYCENLGVLCISEDPEAISAIQKFSISGSDKPFYIGRRKE